MKPQRLRRAIAEGDLAPGADIGRLIAFYQTIHHGLAVRAADGAPRADLMAAVDGAMAAWTELAKPPPAPRAARGKPRPCAKAAKRSSGDAPRPPSGRG